jgi:hypothetical protein
MPSVDRVLPYLQVATALAPLMLAMLIRLAAGGNRVTRVLISLATTWFAVNVLLSPFTDVTRLSGWLR